VLEDKIDELCWVLEEDSKLQRNQKRLKEEALYGLTESREGIVGAGLNVVREILSRKANQIVAASEEDDARSRQREMRLTRLRQTHGQLSALDTLQAKIKFLRDNEDRLKTIKTTRMKSKVQTYDIRDSEEYAEVLELELILRAQLIKKQKIDVNLARGLRDVLLKSQKSIDA